jgi:putative transposase
LPALVIERLEEFKGSFDRLCLQVCGKRYQRHAERQGHRWGMVDSEVGWHGGKAAIRRPRVRQRGGAELELPSWTAMQKADLLSRWAFN